MTTSTIRNRLKYAATLLGAMAFPALAQAQPVDRTPGGGGGCTYTDADGYDSPVAGRFR